MLTIGCGTGMDKEMRCLFIRSFEPEGHSWVGGNPSGRSGRELDSSGCSEVWVDINRKEAIGRPPDHRSYYSDKVSLLKHKAPYSPRLHACCTNIKTAIPFTDCPQCARLYSRYFQSSAPLWKVDITAYFTGHWKLGRLRKVPNIKHIYGKYGIWSHYSFIVSVFVQINRQEHYFFKKPDLYYACGYDYRNQKWQSSTFW